eukprot:scaffold3827_cov179-Cylindrotheca_fusiformis.AAC.3
MATKQHSRVAQAKRDILRMKSANPPPKSISIPGSISSTDLSSANTESMDSDSLEMSSARVDEIIPEAIPENGALNDSFYEKIKLDRFYIDTVDEEYHDEESSLPNRVVCLHRENELSYQQLMDLVEQLRHNQKVAYSALKREKARRRSRESTILKLAKELAKQKDIIQKQQERNEELMEETRVIQAEKSFVDEQLQTALFDLRKAEGDIRKLSENQREQQLAYRGLLHSNSVVGFSPKDSSVPPGRRVLSLGSPTARTRRSGFRSKRIARRKALQVIGACVVVAIAVIINRGFLQSPWG